MKAILICVFCFLASFSQAQFAGRVEFSSSDGVRQPHNLNFIASDGRLWVSSRGGGINMYDGKSWQNFSEEDGLGFSWGVPMFEDREGGIWIWHRYGYGYTRFINDEFIHYIPRKVQTFQDSLRKNQRDFPFNPDKTRLQIKFDTKEIIAIVQDSLDHFYTHVFDYSSDTFNTEGSVLINKKHYSQYKGYRLRHHLDYNNKLNLLLDNGIQTVLIDGNDKVQTFPFVDLDQNSWILKNESGQPYYITKTVSKNGKVKIAVFDNGRWKNLLAPKIKRYGPNPKPIILEYSDIEVNKDVNGKSTLMVLWNILDESGEDGLKLLCEYDDQSLEPLDYVVFAEKNKVKGIVKDLAGGYWYSNQTSIIKLYPEQFFIPSGFGKMPFEAWSVAQEGNGRVWIGSYDSGIFYFDGFYTHRGPAFLSMYDQIYDGSWVDDAGDVYFTVNHTVKNQVEGILKFNSEGLEENICPGVLGFFLAEDNQGQLIYGTHKEGLWIRDKSNNWTKIGRDKGLKLDNVLTAIQDNNGWYWMGRGSQGLAIYNPNKDVVNNWLKEEIQGFPCVQSMDMDSKGNIWLGTNQGLMYFKSDSQFPAKDSMPSKLIHVASEYTGNSMVQVCKVIDEKWLLIGNVIGYFLLDLEGWYKDSENFYIGCFNKENGHLGESISQNGVWVDNEEHVWLMCSRGAVRIDVNNLVHDTVLYKVEFKNITSSKNSYNDFDDKLEFAPGENSIDINFEAKYSALLYDNIRYRYKLNDSPWSSLKEDSHISFSNLDAGEYNLQVLVEKNGLKSEPTVVEFAIGRHFTQNPLFWISIIFLMSTFGILFTRQRVSLEKSKADLSKVTQEKERLHVHTIVNQLNPHFIGNALSWLSIRLDNYNDSAGVTAIKKLSENIRTVFINSRENKSFHSLSSELQLTENYLFLQKCRFRKKLEYELPSEEDIKLIDNVNVPLLSIQIHVENAVEHGILNKRGGGKVVVRCKKQDEYLIIEVMDDGIGRVKAKEIGSKGTQNGIKMQRELRDIYNKQNLNSIKQEYFDTIFTDENGESFGTKVVIEIPIQFNFQI